MTEEALLRQEVHELTELLRAAPGCQALRAALVAEGIPIEGLVLGGYFENEEHGEFGVVVTREGEAFEFERSSLVGAVGFKRWQRVEDIASLLDTFPALRCALGDSTQ